MDYIQSNIEISFILTHPKAILPNRNHDNDTGYDIFAVEDTIIPSKGSAIVPVGLKLGYITPGYWIKIEGRSGLGFKHGIVPHFGVIDEGYRGDLGIKLYNLSDKDYLIEAGKSPAQIVIYPRINANISVVTKATESSRGEKGFNSSNR